MCGIVGVYSEDVRIVPKLVFYSLFSLQHRGQESAGIASFSGEDFKVVKGMGLVTDVFRNVDFEKLKGRVSVGHVRYSTTGESVVENAQPFVVKTRVGSIAIAHNGNLVNFFELRNELEKAGSVFISTTDSEVIAQLLSRLLIKMDLEDAIIELAKILRGSYSLVFAVNDTLVAMRDPFAFRPLCFGEFNGGVVFASESCALDTIGAKFVRDLEPGEAIIVRDGEIESVKVESEREAHCVFEYIYFARPDSVIDGRNVYSVRYKIGQILAEEARVDADIVSPIPDSGTTSAIGFAEKSGIRYIEALIKNRYVGRTFIMPEQKLREVSVRLKVNVLRENVEGKRVVLVDDSIVRGTTSRKIVDMIRRAGAKEVHFRVGSPPIISPCYYGIDMQTTEELIASKKTIEEIRKEIGADSLAYLSLEGLIKAIEMKKEKLCLACLTGEYPVKGEFCFKC